MSLDYLTSHVTNIFEVIVKYLCNNFYSFGFMASKQCFLSNEQSCQLIRWWEILVKKNSKYMCRHYFHITLCQLCIALLDKFKMMTERIKLSFMPLCAEDKEQSPNFWCLLFWCPYLSKTLPQNFWQYMCLKIQPWTQLLAWKIRLC